MMTAAGETITLTGALLACGPLFALLSGVPLLLLKNNRSLGQKLSSLLLGAGSVAGLAGATLVLCNRHTESITLTSTLPFGQIKAAVDPLSALFLLPIFTISLCSSVYALEYWAAEKNDHTVRRLTFFFGLLSGALSLLVMARNGVLFLIVWEIMALACYFALSAEDSKPEVRTAGSLYLITTHLGTLSLFAMFSLVRAGSGSFEFPAAGALDAATPLAAGIFVTTLLGFGMKAGIMPLHVWLPSAHANAPSHVSALMSGVLIKMGIYGIIRTLSFFSHVPLWWGAVMLIAGIVSGILGVAFAIAQHDLKRLLAYHSIENIGIICMGIGVALIGNTVGSPTLTLLGMAGALLHVINHATFKSLLFLTAGSVIHSTHSREIDLMGGLARLMPWTSGLFLVGAVAICGLPPLNGFISEFLIYLGLFTGLKGGQGAAMPFLALAAPALALIGGLAGACFVKVYGIAFLGTPRSAAAGVAHEAGWRMRSPMILLACICALIGLLPPLVAPFLDAALLAWDPDLAMSPTRLATAAPLWWLTLLSAVLLCLLLAGAACLARRLRAAPRATGPTWDCGYLRPSASMQYTASSFAEMLVNFFGGILRPHVHRPSIKGVFPAAAHFESHVPETVLELIFVPLLQGAYKRVGLIRRMQHGQFHLYILYILITLVMLILWAQHA